MHKRDMHGRTLLTALLVAACQSPASRESVQRSGDGGPRGYAGVSFAGGHHQTFTICGSPAACSGDSRQCDLEFSEAAMAQLPALLPPYGSLDGHYWLEFTGRMRPQAFPDRHSLTKTSDCVILVERVDAACEGGPVFMPPEAPFPDCASPDAGVAGRPRPAS